MAEREGFLLKGDQSLASAESEFQFGRYDNCVNRSYYACFQAAVFALSRAGILPRSREEYWGHEYVWAQFNGILITRRKLYPAVLSGVFEHTYSVRRSADYHEMPISRTQAQRALQRARMFVAAIHLERETN